RHYRHGREPGIFRMHPKTIGLVAHTGKPGVADLVNAVAEEFAHYSMSILLEKETAAIAGREDGQTVPELGNATDLLVVVGGDGLPKFNLVCFSVPSPTGWTAYSVSAGGPILDPESGVLVITPICPHVLTNRSIIVAETSIIEIEASDPDYPVFLTLDGRPPI